MYALSDLFICYLILTDLRLLITNKIKVLTFHKVPADPDAAWSSDPPDGAVVKKQNRGAVPFRLLPGSADTPPSVLLT